MTDKIAPKLISSSPQKGSTAIAINHDVVLTFNKAIQIGTGNITISNGTDDTRTIAIPPPISQSEINVSGTKFTLDPATVLRPNSRYTIKIDKTAIQDLSGNKYAGINNTTTLYFDTVDTRAPSLKSALANASNISSNSNIVLTSDEKIQIGTGFITFVSGNDSRTFAITDKQVKISGTTLTINPSVDLNINSTYKVHLDAGVIKDLAPVNNINSAIEFSFSTKATGDKQAPVLQNYAGSGSIGNKLQLTFQEDIIKGKGSFTLINLADKNDKFDIPISDASISQQNQNSLSLESPKIKPEKTYIITAPKGIVTDVAKNAFAGLTTKAAVKFDTHDKTPPTLEISGTKATATNSPIIYTFTASEVIKDFTVDDITVTGGAKGEFKAIAGTNNYTLSVTPTADSTTPVTVNVAAGKFTDLVNNANAATATSTQAVDTVAPMVTITDDTADIATSPILYAFTLSEASNTFTIDEITVTGGTIQSSTLTAISSTSYSLSVKPLPNSVAPILVDVAAGRFADTVGNANFAAVQSVQAVDTVAPTIKIEDNQPSVATGGAVIYTFTLSEPSSNFTLDDITVTGGSKAATLSTLSPTSYALSVTPNDNSIIPITVDVAASKFTNAAGNNNIAGVQSIQEVKTVPTLGKAIDGYLAGSTVTVGTYTTTTEANGDFTLPSSVKGEVVVSGGTDLTTGKAFKGVLKAPEGATTVTPLTTVQQGFIAAGQTPAEAQASVAKAFGFSNTVDLTKYDPIAALTNSSNASAADKKQATDLMANAAKIANFLVTASETLKGAGGDKVTAANAGDAILKSLVNSVSSAGSTGVIDLSNASLLTTVLIESAKDVAKTVTGTTGNFETKITSMAATIASVIKDATDNITAVVATGGSSDALLTSMGNVSKFTQEGSASKLQEIAKTFDPSNSNAMKDLSALATTLTGDAADSAIKKGSTIADPVAPIKPITPAPVTPSTPVTPVIPVTPTTDFTVSTSGSTDASTAKTTFNFLTGNYIYSIANFSADDSLIFPMGQTITIKNEDLTDKKVELHWASKGNEMTVVLTGLTADQDKALLFNSDVGKQFGSTALTYKTSAPTPSNTAQNITISTDGSQNATTGNIAFNILAGDYNFTIADFSMGDSLHFPSTPSVSNEDFTDGIVNLHWGKDGQEVVITLTGLTNDQDKALLFDSSLNSLFGANTLTFIQ